MTNSRGEPVLYRVLSKNVNCLVEKAGVAKEVDASPHTSHDELAAELAIETAKPPSPPLLGASFE